MRLTASGSTMAVTIWSSYEQAVGQSQHALGGHRVDLAADILERVVTAQIDFHAAEAHHAAGNAFQAEHDVALELDLDAFEFVRGERLLAHVAQFLQHHLPRAVDAVGIGGEVDAPHAGIAQHFGKGVDGIGDAVLFADVLEEARRHAAAEHRVQHGEHEAVAVAVGQARACP